LFSTTAVRHGQESNPDPKEIDLEFPGLALVLDAGPGGVVPSSVIDLTGPVPRVVRAGAGDVTAFE
ncbi:MAG TPA: Sua5/YciO/YrdC/YwlC family protein, partial [Polyangiaceae bacterium]